MAIPDEVAGLEDSAGADDDHFVLRLSNHEHVSTRSIVIAAAPDIGGST